jgi:Putative zinc-RING and/or ribbon
MFMRKKLHRLYDSLRCEASFNILERNSFAHLKNLVLKDCYVTLDQLALINSPELIESVEAMCSLLHGHITDEKCQSCFKSNPREACGVCKESNLYRFDVDIAERCKKCEKMIHDKCKNGHGCSQ